MNGENYVQVVSLIGRLHRQFLELVKLELESLGIHEVNNVQALMLYNIGDAEFSIRELTLRGYYLGSNVSYNVKKMVENGYLTYERSTYDLRSSRVQLTPKGRMLRDQLSWMYRRHVERLGETEITNLDLQNTITTLGRLAQFWVRTRDPFSR